MYLSGDFQTKMGCFSTGPPVFDIVVVVGFIALAGVSASLTVIIAAFADLISACLMACAMLCSDVTFFAFFENALFKSGY